MLCGLCVGAMSALSWWGRELSHLEMAGTGGGHEPQAHALTISNCVLWVVVYCDGGTMYCGTGERSMGWIDVWRYLDT